MSTTVSVAGSSYSVPQEGDSGWATDVTNLLIQLATSTKVLQVTSSSFPLTQDLSFGSSYGLKIQYLKSQATNPASTGVIRLGNAESIKWRNAANNADLDLIVNSSNALQYNGINILSAGAASIVNADVSPSAAIAYSKLNLASSIVNADVSNSAAIAYSKLNLSSSIVNADISNSAAIAYSKLNLATSILNADISASAAIAYSKLNLSGSILNADINASAAIARSKLATLTASRVMVTDGSGTESASAVTATELGYVSGVTSAIQTQINGKISNSLTTTTGDMIYASGASTPARLPVGSSGQVLKSVGGVPTWATFSGGINYLSSNPDAEADTSGWSTYADAAGTSPVDGTGGSPNSTWTRTTTSPLRGSGSFIYTHNSGASRQGEGVSYAFTIDSSDKAKVLQISFDYMVNSGTFVAGTSSADSDLTVWIYDVTNATLIQSSSYKLLSGSATIADKFTATFQTASNSTSYRLIIHNGTSVNAAFTMMFDNFNVGPSTYVYGTPVTEWQSWTPTGSWSTNTTYSGLYRRVGSEYEYQIKLSLSGAPTAANLTVNLPSGHVIDTTKLADASGSYGQLPGSTAQIGFVSSSSGVSLIAKYNSTTSVGIFSLVGSFSPVYNANAVTNTAPVTLANTDFVLIYLKLPIVGLGASVQMSDQTDTRVVAMKAFKTSVTTGPATGTWTDVASWDSGYNDTHNGFNSSTGVYTVPVSGYYRVNGIVTFAANSTGARTVQINKNNVSVATPEAVSTVQSVSTASTQSSTSVSTVVYCNSGDNLRLKVLQDSGTTLAYFASNYTTFSVERITGPSAIAASESLNLRYTNTAGTSLSTGVNTLSFATKDYDTHGTFSSNTTFTAPIQGKYSVQLRIAINTIAGLSTNLLSILVNGTIVAQKGLALSYSTASPYTFDVSDNLKLNAGDTVTFQFQNGFGSSVTMSTTVGHNSISIARVGN